MSIAIGILLALLVIALGFLALWATIETAGATMHLFVWCIEAADAALARHPRLKAIVLVIASLLLPVRRESRTRAI